MLSVIHLLMVSCIEGGKSSIILGRSIEFIWVERGASKQLPFLQAWPKSLLSMFWAACGGRVRFKADLLSFMKPRPPRAPWGTSAGPRGLQMVRFPEPLARMVLQISQRTHTALKGRNSWFSSNCLARRKQESLSPSAWQSPKQREEDPSSERGRNSANAPALPHTAGLALVLLGPHG